MEPFISERLTLHKKKEEASTLEHLPLADAIHMHSQQSVIVAGCEGSNRTFPVLVPNWMQKYEIKSLWIHSMLLKRLKRYPKRPKRHTKRK